MPVKRANSWKYLLFFLSRHSKSNIILLFNFSNISSIRINFSLASLSLLFIFFSNDIFLFSKLAISERRSSVSMISISFIGSICPLTWVMLSSSKHLTTWATASTSLIFERNWLPRPSPCDAPFTRPAISTKVNLACKIFFDLFIFASIPNLLSGTSTSPMFGSIVPVSYTHLTLPTIEWV